VTAPDLSRRALLLAGGGALLAGCTSQRQRPRAGPAPPTTPATSPPTTPPTPSAPTMSGSPPTASTHSVSPPGFAAWQPNPNDLDPRCKLTAVRAIEKRLSGSGRSVLVLDAQYGGLLTAAASVLVVTRTWRRHAGRIEHWGATYDVRLTRGSSGWRVTAVHPSHPGPPSHRLTADETAALRSDRIVLPPAAEADLRSGQVHESVLAAMLRLAERYRVGVSVVRSGHPTYVFGTDRLSDHPRGRAFDTYRIDDRLVVDRRTPRRLVVGYMEAAAKAGSYNVGGPYLLGAAPQWFSDPTHHDHVHAGFTT
jgi:hypothetical protein